MRVFTFYFVPFKSKNDLHAILIFDIVNFYDQSMFGIAVQTDNKNVFNHVETFQSTPPPLQPVR